MRSYLTYVCCCLMGLYACSGSRGSKKIVLFATPAVTDSLKQQLERAAASNGWLLQVTTDRHFFQEDSLAGCSAVVSMLSDVDSMGHREVVSLRRYLEAGGGWMLVADTLHHPTGWPWLDSLNGRREFTEEKPARIFMTPAPLAAGVLEKGVKYAIGDNTAPDYKLCATLPIPENNRYAYTMLGQGLDEPMEMAIMPGNDVLFVERKGGVKLYEHDSREIKTIGHFDVFSGIEDGLLGVALDPDYEKNNWVYFYYGVAGSKAVSRLSRLELKKGQLLMQTEKIMMEIPSQRQYCCHSAGYLEFGPGGLLYLSTGDNTNAEATEGYTPVDERPGHELADDQGTSANSNDLRGKILRIKPKPDGTYEIPDGNLFPKDGSAGRPEIYVMGCRNPFRITVDPHNNFLYWGDIGPDTKVPAAEGGTLSFDEVNQARKPGYFGWPYFNGNNEAYPLWDFAGKKERPRQNPQHPVNNSRNNTGVRNLPPAQPAIIWYADGSSPIFPLVGKGGESVMTGPVFYSDQFKNAKYRLSSYYDGKLFIYDWVRRWIMAVTFDKDYHYLRMEPFLENLEPSAPIDMKFGEDGAIYLLEYGTNWFAKNMDARLVRITYAEGNRKPFASIRSDNNYGAVPFTAHLSAATSGDFDKGDVLQYNWELEGKNYSGPTLAHTFNQPGKYRIYLTVTDNHGATDTASLTLEVGNTPPVVRIQTKNNRSFYWDNTSLDYQVSVTDHEDPQIDSSAIRVSFDYLASGRDLAVVLNGSNSSASPQYARGHELFYSLDCKACHTENTASVGPSLLDISHRYAGKEDNIGKLAAKIIAGGSGNWGTRTMSSHPDLLPKDAREIVKYIISLGATTPSLPLRGSLALKAHEGKGNNGVYLLTASYADKGANNIAPLTSQAIVVLRNPLLEVEDFDDSKVSLQPIATAGLTYAYVKDGDFVAYKQLDLAGISSIKYNVQYRGSGGEILLHIDRKNGPVASRITIPPGNTPDWKSGWKQVTATLDEISGLHDLYFEFKSPHGDKGYLFNIDWIYFTKNK
ncbi:PQQ-dependent sugar dehydrogenase [Chitinophaga ginsengisegetis]|nr:PQQ-dependent sugar dehydrogenase [Chitinophaga ginsengisegetis]